MFENVSFASDTMAVLSHFSAISAIPRGSGNEEAVAHYVEEFAKSRGLFCVRDDHNNVYIRRPAAVGYEDAPAVVLQGHLDMVCEANANVTHDFTTDPIRFVLDGDILRADGTTLGADNGVAVAIMLMLLDKADLCAPMLECVFTTSEETGMDGMRHFDCSLLQGRQMINLDSAGEGEATVACAGGVRTDLVKSVTWEKIPEGMTVLSITITGLAGGHSGEDIHRGRTPAIPAMGQLLSRMGDDLRLVSICGGARDNAIPRECTAVVAVSDKHAANTAIREGEAVLRADLVLEDAGFAVEVAEVPCDRCMSAADTMALTSLLRVIPVGVRRMSWDIPGLVETSSSLGVIRTTGSQVEITVSSRSSVSAQLDEMQAVLQACGTLAGAVCTHRSRYPGWAFRSGSRLQECYKKGWQELFGTEAKIIGIHAGLECGLLMEKLPDMDIISIGPDIQNLHSPDEFLRLSSLDRLTTLVVHMLS